MKSPLSRRHALPSWLWTLAAIAATLWLAHALLPVLTPFVATALLTYICYPLQKKLTTRKVNPNLAAFMVMLMLGVLTFAFLLILLPLLFKQMQVLYSALAQLLTVAQQAWLPELASRLGIELNLDFAHFRDWLADNRDSLQATLPSILKNLGSHGMVIVQIFATLLLIPVVFFYFLRDADAIMPRFFKLVPPRHLDMLRNLLGECDAVLGGFMRGQLSVMLLMSLIYSLGLWMVGLDAALPVGLASGLLTFIPFVGATTGCFLGTVSAFSQTGTLIGVIPTLAVFIIGQTLESNYITPKLVGERIGLHPVAVIFALMAFGQLFGFTGVLLALPMAAVTQVGARQILARYFKSPLYLGRTGRF
jgi:predicted PurR-regulated permease PerM